MMKNFESDEEFIHTLIIDDLDKTITLENKELLDQWRASDEANEKTYQEFANIQLGMDKLFTKNSLDVESSWETLDQKISSQTNHLVVDKPRIKIGLWYKIAAAVLVILSVSYYFMESRYIVVSTARNAAITHVTLPDGTDLKLNAATVIKYHKDFINNRKLELQQGEVFIHVIKHSGPQFILALGELEAQDIGTSFNVVKNSSKVAVVVEDGAVALKHVSLNMEVLLTKGKSGTYNMDTKKLTSADNINQNYKSWIDKKFIFQDIPIGDVVQQLGQVYQTPVRIMGESLKNRKLTARLHYQTLDSALNVISASLQCKVTREKDTYVLSNN
jgi:transmembrane sensor